MTLYVMDTDILSLYQRNHPQVCDKIRLARQHNLTIKTTVVEVLNLWYYFRIGQSKKNRVTAYSICYR